MRAETPLQILERGATALGVALSVSQLGQFEQYLAELQKWNRRFNLTATSDLRELITRHVLDSMAGFLVLRDVPPGVEVVDLGSGAGFPGLPIKLARPDLSMVLIEPRQKRAAFLSTVCALLKLQGVSVLDTTVSAKHVPVDLTNRFGWVLLRAVAEPRKAIPLAAPLLAPGGQVVMWLSEQQADRVEGEGVVHRYRIPGANATRALLVASRS